MSIVGDVLYYLHVDFALMHAMLVVECGYALICNRIYVFFCDQGIRVLMVHNT